MIHDLLFGTTLVVIQRLRRNARDRASTPRIGTTRDGGLAPGPYSVLSRSKDLSNEYVYLNLETMSCKR